MKICTNVKNWVEEEIIEPVKKKKRGEKEKCKKKKCKKWCLCCNKWKCWIVTFFYWVVEWVARIIGKWILYTICRIVSAILTLGWTLLVGGWNLWCAYQNSKNKNNDPKVVALLDELEHRPMKTLHLEVIIIDYDEDTKNPITEKEIEDRIAKANRILTESAKIEVKREGKIRRDISASLYRLDSSSVGGKISEWLKATFLLIGRDSVRRLTLYAVGSIQDATGLHQPLYGSVFIEKDSPDTTLAHELGHALLSIANASHVSHKGNLMFVPSNIREADANWPTDVPTLEISQWCTMRRSRWLDWSWSCETCT